mgnify:CR=1 FL=1
MRKSEIMHKTAETEIKLKLLIEGSGQSSIDTGCGFLDHMLIIFAKHARFDLEICCEGDTYVDDHHTVEDIGISLGKAFAQSIFDKHGINRYGDIILPMDEALVVCAVDISGRDYLGFDVDMPAQKVGTFDTELVEEFFLGFSRNANITLHFKKLEGTNTHHIIEAMFKAFGRALATAVKINPEFLNEIPSTKGSL